MKALTLIQPWAYAIANLGKDVENRTWRPPDSVIDTRIAIHAGKKVDEAACDTLNARGFVVPPWNHHVHGAIVATAVVGGYGSRNTTDSPWLVGPFGWFLEDVIALPKPVTCRGAQGLWTLPADVERAVLRQVTP